MPYLKVVQTAWESFVFGELIEPRGNQIMETRTMIIIEDCTNEINMPNEFGALHCGHTWDDQD